LIETGLGVGIGIAVHWRLVHGIGDFVAHRLEVAKISDDGVEIVRQQRPVETGRHDRRQRNAGEVAVIRAHPFDQRALDLGVAPASDAGFDIGRDVRRGGDEGRRREFQAAAGKCLLGDGPAAASRGVWQLPQAMMVLTR